MRFRARIAVCLCFAPMTKRDDMITKNKSRKRCVFYEMVKPKSGNRKRIVSQTSGNDLETRK
jgi:hypothetical protein